MDGFNPHVYGPSYAVHRPPFAFRPPNVQHFQQSAQSFIAPTQELHALLHAIVYQEGFAKKVMDASQASQTDKVRALIQSVGVHAPFKVRYNPTGIHVTLLPRNAQVCFSIELGLCW
ncbi:hypothetical protein P9314_15410 [Paenibacillus validus]|uniref:hypothetical protein n=1 Tax=Paenibacillus validus TaxID=44253 RepID=UPI000FDBD112|nr:hypothetical protein [Paenibacillus validus]MED4602084.1 hypothetical protein [Paenibacillus validus]MED4608487.1 hypothetical protein [Paenibacillus validus]